MAISIHAIFLEFIGLYVLCQCKSRASIPFFAETQSEDQTSAFFYYIFFNSKSILLLHITRVYSAVLKFRNSNRNFCPILGWDILYYINKYYRGIIYL